MLIIDSQWWLHYWEKPDSHSDCDAKNDDAFLADLRDALERNKHKRVVIAGHHPLYSYGNHGGKWSLKDHLFPLTEINKNLYIPLPVLGSAYPFYRGVIGNIQDIPNYRYRELQKELTSLFNEYENIIYAAGHEHNLQYIPKDGQHYIISGSGSKETYVKRSKKAGYVQMKKGFGTLSFYEDGDVWLEFILSLIHI